MRNMTLVTAGLLVLGTVAVSPADAQRFPGFGGVEGRVGLALPDELDTGFGAAADLDLGYVFFPQLRSVIGFDYFRAGVTDRAFGTDRASGSLSAIGGRLGLRFDLSGMGALQPYGIAALTGHDVTVEGDTEPQDVLLDREYGGFVVGASVGAGLTYALNEPQTFRVVAEARRGWSANVSHFAIDIGLRIVPRGARAYDPVLRDPRDRRMEAEAEERRAERERREAAERRAERERVEEAEEEEARRAEEERRERMTEEQRRRAELETEEARTEAERAAAARREAEAEAAGAREEAEAARAEAEDARRQTREAEEQLYQSLQNLNRLMTNVTEIRETERGLSVVLGQGLFGVGQSELSARAREEVGRIAAVLSQYPQHRIAVEGHTDATGSLEANQRLSEQRAASVRAALVATGIDPGRVETVGHGPRLPIADNATADGRSQNRRVEIVILGASRPGA